MQLLDRTEPVTSFLQRHAVKLISSAALLAASAFVVHTRTRRAERENPPRGKFIEVDAVSLHYVDYGEGPPLVLFHGNGSMIEEMQLSGVPERAAQRYRVIVFDRPGFGHSERPAGRNWSAREQAALFYRAMRALGVERAVVVGHSWGTFVALWLALDYPQAVRSLVLLSGYYFPTVRLDVPLLSAPALPVLGDLMRHTISPLIGRMLYHPILWRVFGPARVPRRFIRFPVWMSLRPAQLKAAARETARMIPTALALRRRYSDLRVPVLIMAGQQDLLVMQHFHSTRLHRMLPGSELRLAGGAGHMVHHTVPDEVVAAIARAFEMSDRNMGC